MTEMVTFDVGSEIAECTPQLRWVRKSMLQAMDLKLQQAWHIRSVNKNGHSWGSRIEWRDVPTDLTAVG